MGGLHLRHEQSSYSHEVVGGQGEGEEAVDLVGSAQQQFPPAAGPLLASDSLTHPSHSRILAEFLSKLIGLGYCPIQRPKLR